VTVAVPLIVVDAPFLALGSLPYECPDRTVEAAPDLPAVRVTYWNRCGRRLGH
jgi:hypothetical protein